MRIQIHRELSSARLITMEFIDNASRIDTVAAPNLSSVLNNLVGYSIFHEGFCHADLHAGNILVRRRGKPSTSSSQYQTARVDASELIEKQALGPGCTESSPVSE